LARLEALPDRVVGHPSLVPADWQIEAMRRYVGRKRVEDIAAELGVSRGTLLKWRKEYLSADT